MVVVIHTVAFRHEDPTRSQLTKLAHDSAVIRRDENLGHLASKMLDSSFFRGYNVVFWLGELEAFRALVATTHRERQIFLLKTMGLETGATVISNVWKKSPHTLEHGPLQDRTFNIFVAERSNVVESPMNTSTLGTIPVVLPVGPLDLFLLSCIRDNGIVL